MTATDPDPTPEDALYEDAEAAYQAIYGPPTTTPDPTDDAEQVFRAVYPND